MNKKIKRTQQIIIYLTEDEKEILKNFSVKENLGVSALIRYLIFKQIKKNQNRGGAVGNEIPD